MHRNKPPLLTLYIQSQEVMKPLRFTSIEEGLFQPAHFSVSATQIFPRAGVTANAGVMASCAPPLPLVHQDMKGKQDGSKTLCYKKHD